MKTEVTYIFHNCFIIRRADKTFLFDYPGEEYLNEAIRNEVTSRVRDSQLYIFSSHFHADHFNRHIADLSWPSQTTTYIFSKDIIKKNRRFRDMASCQMVEPDQTYSINGIDVETFRSNDAGVAFFIRIDGVNIYFGGDLANWAWEDNSRQEKLFLEYHFGEVLNKIVKCPVHIGFSNTDARLSNWSGAKQFIETVHPGLFVPMHCFGKTDSISKFLAENPEIKSPVFQYRKTGDKTVYEV